jgi:outer membrane scaffolding protein for murein synthesis (MipA/OmpV family)
MSRRTVYSMFASMLAVFALIAVPATSFAESSVSCTATAVCVNTFQDVEVYPFATVEYGGRSMNVP